MTGLQSILPSCSYHPSESEYEYNVGDEDNTVTAERIREVEHVIRGVVLVQGGEINIDAWRTVAEEIREQQREEIRNIEVRMPKEIRESVNSIARAGLTPGEQERVKNAKEKLVGLRTNLLDKHIDRDIRWNMRDAEEVKNKAEELRENKEVSFELTTYTGRKENSENVMKNEVLSECSDYVEIDLYESPGIFPEEFGFSLPITLPSCVIKHPEVNVEDRYAYIPWNGVMACTCRRKHNHRSRTVCHHEILALQEIGDDKSELEFSEQSVPQRLKRFVHKSGYKKAVEVLNV